MYSFDVDDEDDHHGERRGRQPLFRIHDMDATSGSEISNAVRQVRHRLRQEPDIYDGSNAYEMINTESGARPRHRSQNSRQNLPRTRNREHSESQIHSRRGPQNEKTDHIRNHKIQHYNRSNGRGRNRDHSVNEPFNRRGPSNERANYSRPGRDQQYGMHRNMNTMRRWQSENQIHKGRGQHNENINRSRIDGGGQSDMQNGPKYNRTERGEHSNTPRFTEQRRFDQIKMKGLGFYRDLQDKEPARIVLALGSKENGFQELVNSEYMKPEMFKILISLLKKCCSCNSTPEILNKVLSCLPMSQFFTNHVQVFFIRTISDESAYRQEAYNQAIKDFLTLLNEMCHRMPNSFTAIQGALGVVKMTVDKLQDPSNAIDSEIFEKLKLVETSQEQMFKKLQEEPIKQKTPNCKFENEPPPDDFRDISVFPIDRDIHSDEQPYIRPSKVCGRYNNLDHYLDVQFRLLREDFIAPLRNGITEYLEAVDVGRRGKGKNKISDIRVYDDVKIICPVCSYTSLEYKLSFDVTRFKYVNWAISKRLIHGSLLCLSSDNFKTFLFATVAERKPEHLKQGFINVKFENGKKNILKMDAHFTMAETTAFFEAYRHVLTGMQKMKDGDLPFECHIVECEEEVKPPAYLTRRGGNVRFDLRPLIDRKVVLKDLSHFTTDRQYHGDVYEFSPESQKAKSVKILNKMTWPSPEDLHLDESQYTAIQTALTSQFVITQGPPGTGKTYIGLQIVRALLHNKDVWSVNQNGVKEHKPLLIVCYTNHALDQFLEELSDFYTGGILRLGSRCSNEKLKPFTLREMRQNFRKTKSLPREIFRAKIVASNEMKVQKDAMDRLAVKIESAERDILHENLLQPFIGEQKFRSLVTRHFAQPGLPPYVPTSFIVEWLQLGQITCSMEGQQFDDVLDQDDDDNVKEDGLIDVFGEIDAMENLRHVEDEDDCSFDQELDEDFQTDQLDDITEGLLHLDIRKCIAFTVSNLDGKSHGKNINVSQQGWEIQPKARKKMKKEILKRLRNTERMKSEDASKIHDVWAVESVLDRWKLYKLWVHNMCEHIRSELAGRVSKYQDAAERYQEILLQEDKEVMRRATVIGATTTCAARYQAVLKEIGPRIIVVEEAAEVLEAHVITSLSQDCQHLILIGDHKQLKPNPSVYKLAKFFNLEISLFERMIKNGLQCDCLQLQHRMRPEISSIMKHIYPKLQDDVSVQNYESLQGIGYDMFFISHTELEDYDQDNRSHSNLHEAKYVVALCKYLILQGYSKSQITVLTPYSGQLFQLRKLMPKSFFDGVRVTVVDNFQGEENDIILLSLVRSNEEESVGFLKIENRVCVALSRARKGLYVIGNFSLLEKKSDLWRDILNDLKKSHLTGPALPLYCQNHPDQRISVDKAEDFNKAPEGGCLKPCGFRLPCGHCCPKPCHVTGKDHADIKCQKPCEKVLCINGHRCERKCYQDCGDCEILVSKIMPLCGHEQNIPCYMRPPNFKCLAQCSRLLKCGHGCTNRCGDNCTVYCHTLTEKIWPCGHTGEVRCNRKDIATCTKECTAVLECGHTCVGTCGECFQFRLHKSCKELCNRTLVCNHQCKDYCSNCPPCELPCGNHCEHSHCTKLCGDLCSPCIEKCNWQCEHYQCTKLCSEDCDRPRCDKPCKKKLECGHQCAGVCGEPCPTLCKQCHPELTEIFLGSEDEEDALFVQLEDCQHTFAVNDMDYYMDNDMTNENPHTIQMKTCPRCKTPILRNLRYCNIIKKRLSEVESVKQQMINSESCIPKMELDQQVTKEKQTLGIEDQRDLNKYLNKPEFVRTVKSLTAVINIVRFLKEVRTIKSNIVCLKDNDHSPIKYTDIQESVENLRIWLLTVRKVMTNQECSDAQNEIDRLSKIVKICIAAVEISRSMHKEEKDKIMKVINPALKCLQSVKPLNPENKRIIDDMIRKLKSLIPKNSGFTDAERVMVVKAMGLAKGHWFKCKNGHIYSIGECGGATEEGTCPECKTKIGGHRHQLRQDNTLASDFDGATSPAWPTATGYQY